ncbi:MAG TPA: hypothetical protein VHE23_03915 [Candidatus Acidoferrales bacterium]|nr:hypothetical protein [Candidatus Acidoferrales bacterium]
MSQRYECSETGRSFDTADEARASETRVPDLRNGDVIYVGTALYLSHGRDDFCGGLAEVLEVKAGLSAGASSVFVRLAQEPDTLHNWPYLAAKQKEVRERFGKNWAHPDPDNRPEFNEW